MPYISNDKRKKYETRIDSLASTLNRLPDNDSLAGELNYFFYCLAKHLCDPNTGGEKSYARMAVVSSALSEAQAEFRRRIMAPYEDKKIESNGDVG